MLTGPRFGRGKVHDSLAAAPTSTVRDLRLFAYTFAGGFLFMTIYLG